MCICNIGCVCMYSTGTCACVYILIFIYVHGLDAVMSSHGVEYAGWTGMRMRRDEGEFE